MEVVLLLIGAGVAYFLYITLQDYLKNPLHQQSFAQPVKNQNVPQVNFIEDEQNRLQNRIKESEYGLLCAILGAFAKSDGKVCEQEEILIEDMIDEMLKDPKSAKLTKESLLEIYQNTNARDLEMLCESFTNVTKGEYKKRLKVVEFLFVLAYADGEFAQEEKDMLIDIAAFFELSNEDFNRLYNEFEALHEQKETLSKEKALELFNLKQDYTQDELHARYVELTKAKKGNILGNKNMGKSLLDGSAKDLREIEEAYKILQAQSA